MHVALLTAFAVALRLGSEWNARLVIYPVHGQILAGQASDGDSRAFQRIVKTEIERSVEYGFVNFNQDPLKISFRISTPDFKRYNSSYGYRPEDIQELRAWRENAIQSAYRLALAEHKNQKQVDAAAAALEKEYQRRLLEYLESRGFKVEADHVTRVDIPTVVKRNAPQIKSLAQSFERLAAQRGYRSMDIIGAVLSFAQTALLYRQPKDVYKGKHTGGILPPLTAVVLGWGDCDTKTAMLASILSNWAQMRMVGISVPGHYLMAVLQIPDKGDLFVEYEGLKYILLEPAGPAWLPPGHVADETVAQLNGSDGYKIYPFF